MISKKDLDMIKGIAVLLMVWCHMYTDADRILQHELTGFFGSAEIMAQKASFGHVFAAFFVFAAAYGMTRSKKSMFIASGLEQYGKIVRKAAFTLTVLVLLSYVSNYGKYIFAVWGKSRGVQALGLISSATGLAGILQLPWFAPSWQYLGLYLALMAVLPVLWQLVDKFGLYICAAALFLPYALGVDAADENMVRYLFPAVIGIICAGYEGTKKIRLNKKAGAAVFILFLPVTVQMSLFTEAGYLLDNVALLQILCIALFCIKRMKWFYRGLCILGKHAMTICLVHEFVFGSRFFKSIYGMRNVWVIWSAVIIISLVFSVFMDCLYEGRFWKLLCRLYNSVKGKAVLSVLLSIACFAFMACFTQMAYDTNDDGQIQMFLSGDATGSPYMTHQFIHVILGAVISGLYTLFPKIQWWYVYSQGFMLIGMILIHFMILYIGGRKGHDFIHILPFLAFIDGGFLLHSISNVSFTIAPMVFGSGLIGLVFLSAYAKTRKQKVCIFVIVLFGFVTAYMHRQASGLVLLCYILLMWLYVCSSEEWKIGIRKFAVLCIGFVAAAGVLSQVDCAVKEKINGADFTAYNAARIKYMDYPHDSYSDHVEIYQDVDWDESLARLVTCWFFMDERVSTDNFRYLTENSRSNTSYLKIAGETLEFAFLDKGNQAVILTWAASAVLSLFVLLLDWNWKFFVFWMFNHSGSILLLLYQAVQGRVIYRSVVAVILPAFFVNLLLTLAHYEAAGIKKAGTYAVLCVCLAVCGPSCLGTAFSYGNELTKSYMQKVCKSMEHVVNAEKDNIYITAPGIYDKRDTGMLRADSQISNLIIWGGCSFHSKGDRLKLKNNGLSDLSGDVFFNEKVYFLCTDSPKCFNEHTGNSNIEILYRYLKERYQVKGFVLDQAPDGISYAYRFVFEENKDRYESYCSVLPSGSIYKVQKGKSDDKF